ncbi:pyridoxamine 5'-phosphate oxidase family protein [Polaribacter sp. Hel1_85]|uniref:pyridoxamine 5'-phosphate oxidase family protein n=1 Tax=Polaribacter sp. Hel1_85 TaxID=1250005 RepID=UPI00052D0159|nr:pyridoxamine 5'-phosphate oxidase family protein [Polaribacter sp. Hel1_85]KGL62485.1 pyridoxamine 5'-phosphate oxidase-like FMN-binding protein [Polaribacter sp. Hel1_85]
MITDLKEKECRNLLADNYIGQLGYIYNGRPFIVPITYFFDNKNILVVGYSTEGHKTIAMRKNNNVSVQVSEIKDVNRWGSVLAHGLFEEITGSDAKRYLHEFTEGIKNLIIKKEEKHLNFIGDFSSKTHTNKLPIVYKINISEITGKRREQ